MLIYQKIMNIHIYQRALLGVVGWIQLGFMIQLI